MIASGYKKEEYREITPYWCSRLALICGFDQTEKVWSTHTNDINSMSLLWGLVYEPIAYEQVEFTLGYPKISDLTRRVIFDRPQIRIGTGRPEWGAEEGKMYFVISWKK